MAYDLELDRVAETIQKEKAQTVCIQLPEGLKPKALEIVDELKSKTGAHVLIWAESCFGACDIPHLDVDLFIQWGHAPWITERRT